MKGMQKSLFHHNILNSFPSLDKPNIHVSTRHVWNTKQLIVGITYMFEICILILLFAIVCWVRALLHTENSTLEG